MSRLATKVAIVTGAASGIGLGIAQFFSKKVPRSFSFRPPYTNNHYKTNNNIQTRKRK